MAGAEGFEPPVSGPKPDALPLGYAPTRIYIITTLKHECIIQRHIQHRVLKP